METIKKEHYIDTTIHKADVLVRALKSELKKEIENLDIGITSEQFAVLDTIRAYENIYPEKLSKVLIKDKSNTTRILKVLEQKGFIKREISKENNRLIYILKTTETGDKILKETMPKIKKFITDIFANITDQEIDNLHTLADKLQKDLSRLKI